MEQRGEKYIQEAIERRKRSSEQRAESGEEVEGRRHFRQEAELEGDRKKRKRGDAETGRRTQRRRRDATESSDGPGPNKKTQNYCPSLSFF